MQKYLYSLFIAVLLVSPVLAQNDGGSFGIKFSGFVKTDVFFDTRQTVTAREGHFLLYPAPESLDPADEDINSGLNFNMLSIQSRLKGSISAPDAFGAKTSGVIEAAFFGHSNGDINGLRLRHAFVRLDWENTSILAGQTWHPLFMTDCYPGVVSFNTGVPFQPFSRNPQLKLEQDLGGVKVAVTAYAQRDFASTGPNGGTSQYLRDAGIPGLNATLKYVSSSVAVGGGVDMKTLKPRLATGAGYKAEETISSMAFQGFVKIATEAVTIKAQAVYGENMTDLLMLGGYGVSSISQPQDVWEYTATKTMSFWGDLSFGKQVQGGVFFGYSKNMGANDPVVGNIYMRGSTIETLLRVSPRVIVNAGKFRFATEVEITSAAYGVPDAQLEVQNAEAVTNARLLFATFLFF